MSSKEEKKKERKEKKKRGKNEHIKLSNASPTVVK